VISPGRRRELNRALHELRRPLQALMLLEDSIARDAADADARRGLVELASLAAGDLDRALNGGGERRRRDPVRCRELVLASLERWRPAAPGAIKVYWDAGPGLVEGDGGRMARAFDNLIANALEHGAPPLVVTGAEVGDRLRITVANRTREGAAGADGDGRTGLATRLLRRRDPRRGHGTAVVSEVAAAHHGRFALCRTGAGCVAALELPLAQSGLARAA